MKFIALTPTNALNVKAKSFHLNVDMIHSVDTDLTGWEEVSETTKAVITFKTPNPTSVAVKETWAEIYYAIKAAENI